MPLCKCFALREHSGGFITMVSLSSNVTAEKTRCEICAARLLMVLSFQRAGHQRGYDSVSSRAGLCSSRRLHGDLQQTHPGPGGPQHAGGAELAKRPGKQEDTVAIIIQCRG